MKFFLKFFIDLLLPIQCLGCGKNDTWLCPGCLEKIDINESGLFVSKNPLSFLDGVWAAIDYHQPLLPELLHRFKYNFIVELGEILAGLLIEFLKEKNKNQKLSFDLVLAVPLAKKREVWRGFNQAEVLAKKVSFEFGWAFTSDLLFRRYSRPQVGLKAEQRFKNIKGVFEIRDKNLIRGKKILLIDDVITTGSTINECAKVLKKSGAGQVWGLAVAKD